MDSCQLMLALRPRYLSVYWYCHCLVYCL